MTIHQSEQKIMEKKQPEPKPEELSEEDKILKDNLALFVCRLEDSSVDLHLPALEALKDAIRTSTSTMTSVPKPIKFLCDDYQKLVKVYQWAKATRLGDSTYAILADIMSVLSMAYGNPEKHETLFYRLDRTSFYSGPEEISLSEWGHEYVVHLAMEIIDAYRKILLQNESSFSIHALLDLAKKLIPLFISRNAEPDAVDLALELAIIDDLLLFIDEDNYGRISLYLESCLVFEDNNSENPDVMKDVTVDINTHTILSFLRTIYKKVRQPMKAFQTSLRNSNIATRKMLIEEDWREAQHPLIRKQMCFSLARLNISLDEEYLAMDATLMDEFKSILNNEYKSKLFKLVAKDCGVDKERTPEDVYKSHLENLSNGGGANRSFLSAAVTLLGPSHSTDSHGKTKLVNAIVNGFINLGHGTDSFLLKSQESESSSTKTTVAEVPDSDPLQGYKDMSLCMAIASMGLTLLWDLDGGLSALDKYLSSSDTHIKAGALLALGLASQSIRNEAEPVFALLSEYVTHEHPLLIRLCAVLGLGLSYAGSNSDNVLDLLLPLLNEEMESNKPPILNCYVGLVLGFVFIGNGNSHPSDMVSSYISLLLERSSELANLRERMYLMTGLGFLFFQRKSEIDTLLETLSIIGSSAMSEEIDNLESRFSRELQMMIRIMATTGSGDVSEIQQCFKVLYASAKTTGEKLDIGISETAQDKAKSTTDQLNQLRKNSVEQELAIMGISLVSCNDEISIEMCERLLGHVLNYASGENVDHAPWNLKSVLPFAYAIMEPSCPDQGRLVDILSKLSHDNNSALAANAITALGIISLGSNNSRLQTSLRDLLAYHARASAQIGSSKLGVGLGSQSVQERIRISQALASSGRGLVQSYYRQFNKSVLHPTKFAGLFTSMLPYLLPPVVPTGGSKKDPLAEYHEFHQLIFLFITLSISPRSMLTLDAESLELNVIEARVGQALDNTAQPGRPKTLTGFQTQNTPCLIAPFNERAELVSSVSVSFHDTSLGGYPTDIEWISYSEIMEDVVLIGKNPRYHNPNDK